MTRRRRSHIGALIGVAVCGLVLADGQDHGVIWGRAPCTSEGRTTGQTIEETAAYRIYAGPCTYARTSPQEGPISYAVGGPTLMVHCKKRWVYRPGVAGRKCPGWST